MTFRQMFTLVVFVIFVGLCGYELIGNIVDQARQDVRSVRYVGSMDNKKEGAKKEFIFDMKRMKERMEVKG